MRATGGQQITGLMITDETDSDIALGPVTFGSRAPAAASPEPGTFAALLGTGLPGVALLQRLVGGGSEA